MNTDMNLFFNKLAESYEITDILSACNDLPVFSKTQEIILSKIEAKRFNVSDIKKLAVNMLYAKCKSDMIQNNNNNNNNNL